MSMKEQSVVTQDDVRIAFNHAALPPRTAVVIVAPGWAMTKDSKVFTALAEALFEKIDVIVLDFRGHGRSGGRYTFSAKEPNDLHAVVAYAQQHYSVVHLMGFSMGGAIALLHTAQYNDVQSVIAISAPSDFDKVENHWFKPEAFIPTFKKFEWSRLCSIRVGNVLSPKRKPIDVIQTIHRIPILFLAGEKDPTVSAQHSYDCYEQATTEKALHVFPNGLHAEDLYLSFPDDFLNRCFSWFQV